MPKKKLDLTSKQLNYKSGQSLLIILLVTAVILTVGLAVASYSITDIKISQQEEESSRAFSAAETGIEESLKLGSAKDVTVGEIVAKVSETVQGGGQNFDFDSSKFTSGELANIWLVGHNTSGGLDTETYFPFNGQLKICWGNDTAINSSTPAIELILVYKNSDGDYKIIRQGYDPVSGRTVGFLSPDDTDGGNCGSLAFAKDINLSGGNFNLTASDIPYLLRLKLLYNTEEQAIAVNASDNLPNQGKCYESSAEIKTSGITRKIRQCQFFQAPPEIFDYVLFTTGDLVK